MTFIGTAGWSIPAAYKGRFRTEGSHLVRYGALLNCAEINSSFYRPHQRKTYERWAASVPDDFRFSVKLPQSITKHARLTGYGDLLVHFADEISGLDRKLAVILVQLMPSLVYDARIFAAFIRDLRRHTGAAIACEPRHASWFEPKADAALARLRVARVAADPPRAPTDGAPGGWTGLAYWRLHGSPKVYYSPYSDDALHALAPRLRRQDWCVFDNTTSGAALGNALTLRNAF